MKGGLLMIEILIDIVYNPIIVISLFVLMFFKIKPPKKINSWYGYRTIRSQQSQRHWDFAQRYSARITIGFNSILLVAQVVTYSFLGSTAYVDLGLIALWLIGMAICIYSVERKLMKIT